MEKQIINQCSIEDPIVRKLFEEEDFEQLLQYCSEKTDVSALLYKAIALFEMGEYEEGKHVYIEYYGKNDMLQENLDKEVGIMESVFTSAIDNCAQKVTDISDKELGAFGSSEDDTSISACAVFLEQASSIVKAICHHSNTVIIAQVDALLAEAAVQFICIFLETTQKTVDSARVVLKQKMQALSTFDTSKLMGISMRQTAHINRIHLLHEACLNCLNFCTNQNCVSFSDKTKKMAQQLVEIILITLNISDRMNLTWNGAIVGSVKYMLLDYKKETKSRFEERQKSIDYLTDAIRCARRIDPGFIAPEIPSLYDPDEKPKVPQSSAPQKSTASSGGCYVATAVYGSYDCPQVWTLRRYRDNTLAETWYGRAFIRTYYAISPTIVKWFGHTEWFKKLWKVRLDALVQHLQCEGIADTPYTDKTW